MNRPVMMYLGGFARIGGIEAFARDFLLAIAPHHPARELVIWGRDDPANVLLRDIAASGATITASPWRWGCVWDVPDWVLLGRGLAAVRRAGIVVFKRPPPGRVLALLRRAAHSSGRRIPFLLIVPYRPREYWPDGPDPAMLASFEAICVQSDEGVDDLRRAGYRGRLENIPLLPPPVAPPADFPAARGDGVVRLGYLGRLEAQKNLGYLLEVYRELTRAPGAPRYELHLFGEGAQRAGLEARSRELALEGVTFHGAVPRAEINQRIDRCDLFLITSTTEGQCLVALEVLARGRPLVATPVGSLPEVLRQEETGRLAPLGQPEVFAAEVIGLAREILADRLTPERVAAAFLAQYDHAAVLQRYLNLIADLLHPARRSEFAAA